MAEATIEGLAAYLHESQIRFWDKRTGPQPPSWETAGPLRKEECRHLARTLVLALGGDWQAVRAGIGKDIRWFGEDERDAVDRLDRLVAEAEAARVVAER